MKTNAPKSPMKFYTIEQIAECVDASTRTVRRWIEKGLRVAHRINGLGRISEADFQSFPGQLTMSLTVGKSHRGSIAYGESGKLSSSIRPIYSMLGYPNIRLRHPVSSRDIA
jgi:excisionase family DNA binding protein